MQSLVVVPGSDTEAGDGSRRKADGQHHPTPRQAGVALGVAAENRAHAGDDLPQRLKLREEALETGQRPQCRIPVAVGTGLWIVPDELWALIEPLLPEPAP